MAIQSDGRIVVAGMVIPGTEVGDVLTARYLPDGRLDSGFGHHGMALGDFTNLDRGFGVALGPGGTIVVAGACTERDDYFQDFAVVRYRADGKADSTFGRGGRVITDYGRDDLATSVAIQFDGKIVVAGSGSTSSGRGGFALARYLG